MRPVASTLVLRFGDGVMRLVFDQADVLPGLGVHLLQLPVVVAGGQTAGAGGSVPLPPGAVVLLTGELYTAGPSLTLLAQLAPRSVVVREFDLRSSLEAAVGDAQLEALERQRGGEDLSLLLKLSGLLISLPGRPVGHPEVEVDHTVRVGRAHWGEQLARTGLATGVHVVARLPAGGSPDGPTARAGRRLRSAQSAVVDGRYEDAVRDGRLALDALDELDPAPNPAGVRPRERNQAQRWAALRHDLHSLASGAHHEQGSTIGFTWSREDAVAVIAFVTSLLARLGGDR